jgi:hypothetical protein
MRRYIFALAALGTLALGSAVILFNGNNSYAASCNQAAPLGAISPADPGWCHAPLGTGIDTHGQGANFWLDDFDHGQTHASLNSAYRTFVGDIPAEIHFQHNNHWMADLQASSAWNGGNRGAVMRPDRSFRFEEGRLVIEADVAAGVAD